MPFCMQCGAKIPDSAKFCPECGASIVGTERSVDMVPAPKLGTIRVYRRSNFNTGAFDCAVTVDNGQPQKIADGCEINIETTAGNHDVVITSGASIQRYSIVVPANGVETVSFSLGDGKSQTKASTNGNNIRCPKCGGEVNFQTVTESSGLGCGSFIGVILFALLACLISVVLGIIIFVIGMILIVKGSDETVTYAVCQKCGHRFRKN